MQPFKNITFICITLKEKSVLKLIWISNGNKALCQGLVFNLKMLRARKFIPIPKIKIRHKITSNQLIHMSKSLSLILYCTGFP